MRSVIGLHWSTTCEFVKAEWSLEKTVKGETFGQKKTAIKRSVFYPYSLDSNV